MPVRQLENSVSFLQQSKLILFDSLENLTFSFFPGKIFTQNPYWPFFLPLPYILKICQGSKSKILIKIRIFLTNKGKHILKAKLFEQIINIYIISFNWTVANCNKLHRRNILTTRNLDPHYIFSSARQAPYRRLNKSLLWTKS